MSAPKTISLPGRQRRATTRAAAQQQSSSQVTMAAAAAHPRSLETDAVAVPDLASLKQGYRLQIFDKEEERSRYACGFCGKILREPLQAECGHRFCTDCQKAVEESTERGDTVQCKVCKDEGLPDGENKVDPKEMFPDRGIQKEMMKIRAKCPNEMCVWAGLFKDYVTHERECPHQPLVCEHCREHVSKQKMDQHKTRDCPHRIIRCDHCNVDIIFQEKKDHLKDCPKVPESCSQCSKHIPRDKMKKHQSRDCPNRTVDCPIEGCCPPQQQNRFSQHVQKDQLKHLTWMLTRVGDLEESVNALTTSSQASGGAASAATAAQQGSAALSPEDLQSLRQNIQQLERQVQQMSPPEGATGGGGGASGQSGDRVDAMELKVNTLEPILSVLHGEMNRCICAIEALETRLMQETRLGEEWRRKMEQYETTVSGMTASLTQRDARMRALETQGQDRPDGTLLWRIPNFSQVRKDALSGTVTNIHSRPFFSGPLGYKMCVRLYPNGDGMGKGSHLSLFFSIMRSPNDALLPWPFKQKVYFMLVDQTFKKHIVDAFRSEPSSSSFQRPTSEMNIATGCPMFVQLNKLTQPSHGYIKEDTMYIRVLVETDGLDDHLKQFDPRTMPLQQ